MRPLACLPDRIGSLLAHAALDEPERAVAAWREARRTVDPDPDLPPAEARRLFPLVHRNLLDVDLDEQDRAHLRHHYEWTRILNESRVAVAARWLEALELGGVPTTVLKGLPLALRDYRDLAARPMLDIDLLVPLDLADRALDLLADAGWRDPGRPVPRETVARLYHGAAMFHPDGGLIDLHWHLAGFLTEGYDPRLEDLEVGGVATTSLDRTDTLVHTCLHGAWTGSGATARWVADAVVVARATAAAGEALDRERILALGEAHDIGAILGAALGYIVDEHDAPVPAGLVGELQAQRPGWRVRHRQRIVTEPPQAPARLPGLRHLRAYWTYTRWGWDDATALRWGVPFLVEAWGLDSPRQLPAAAVAKARGRGRSRPRP